MVLQRNEKTALWGSDASGVSGHTNGMPDVAQSVVSKRELNELKISATSEASVGLRRGCCPMGGVGFDIVYDKGGGASLDASFVAAKRYTGHAVSALGWGSHSLAPLSFHGATYSGVFTLFPLVSGEGRAYHGEILAQVSVLADAGRLRPLLYKEGLNIRDIGIAHDLVASATLGKVIVEL